MSDQDPDDVEDLDEFEEEKLSFISDDEIDEPLEDDDEIDELLEDDEFSESDDSFDGDEFDEVELDDPEDDEEDDEFDELLEDDEVQPLDDGDDDAPSPQRRKKPEVIEEDEFTCTSCFLVKKSSQLADSDGPFCFDCA